MYYIKTFETRSQYEAFTATTEFIKPNTSYCIEDEEIYYTPADDIIEEKITSTCYIPKGTTKVTVFNPKIEETNFKEIEIDGVIQKTVQSSYTFTQGWHTIKYTLASPTYIGDDLFDSCYGLTSISIPSGVTRIGNSTFYNCSGFTSCTFEQNSQLTIIDVNAFQNCSNLTSIEIPSGVTSIGGGAFSGCSSLVSVTVNAITPPELAGRNVFENNGKNRLIYVPSESLRAYQNAWSEYSKYIVSIT